MTFGCISAFGSGSVGSMPFGSGVALAIVLVRQDTLNSAIVTFSAPPRANDPGDVRDALDVALWTLTPVGTARARLVQFIESWDELSVRVFFDGPLDPFAQYTLSVLDSVTAAAGGSLSAECSGWTFDTMGWPRDLVPSVVMTPTNVDIANPFMPRDAPSPGAPLGTYQISNTGDWLNDSGRTNLRKRMFRRLTTPPAGFFHLPDYGSAPELETLIRRDDLQRLQQSAKRGIMSEPDVTNAVVSAQQSKTDPSIVLLTAVVTDIYGSTETVSAAVRPRRAS